MSDTREQGKKPLSREGESLGWMVGSTILPKKARLIEGVGIGAVLDMKAELYKAQEEARFNPETRARRRGPIEIKNSGVAERDRKDRAAIKTDADRLADSAAALERKAAIYERLAAGVEDDEEEAYNVDFFAKAGTLDEEAARMAQEEKRRSAYFDGGDVPDTAGDAVRGTGMVSDDMLMEQRRREWEQEEGNDMASTLKREAERDVKLQALEKVERETKEGRERAAKLRQQREQAERAKRERLKQAFLQQQLAAIRTGKLQGKQVPPVAR